jgi:hypothetical protein
MLISLERAMKKVTIYGFVSFHTQFWIDLNQKSIFESGTQKQ